MIISAIAAVARNGVIGKDNQLPWHLSEDLKFFKQTTTGHCIILGRRNYEAIGRPLPNRTNIVLTRQSAYTAPGCTVVSSLDGAFQLARTQKETECFVVGGGEIYAQAMPMVQRMYLTILDKDFAGDVFFPTWKGDSENPLGPEWVLRWYEDYGATSQRDWAFRFTRWERQKK